MERVTRIELALSAWEAAERWNQLGRRTVPLDEGGSPSSRGTPRSKQKITMLPMPRLSSLSRCGTIRKLLGPASNDRYA
ncbi:hypothetical protein GCM10018980_30230 [Streptomyces capoamus]|uniref:Uncharacterized protein n=1 Tax=Streptomyces capoamus TaxID=68183 RepID=A0A919C412_9ACTN|nr:hypothetical protein GCM10010501_41370 [Streptomyces libani subsp. rufus]GHG49431.1 hypothetical protein GCM10018980_30230 [Streptomyces capoamus]